MIEESVEHALEDLKARQWIEAKLRADETLAATRKGLAECSDELDEACRKQIETAMAATESALAAQDAETMIGDPAKLKAASAALDEATRPLAELLMDKAMEGLLRKRGLIQ
jgi:molecular chaperone DnaK (HSP70)